MKTLSILLALIFCAPIISEARGSHGGHSGHHSYGHSGHHSRR